MRISRPGGLSAHAAAHTLMCMSEIKPFEIPGARGEPVRGYVHPAEGGDGPAPTVLLAHGFKGFADYGFLPQMADRLAEAGISVVRLSFSHCGIENDPDHFTRPDLFEKDTFDNQIRDILSLVSAVADGTLPAADRLDVNRLGVIGHSRGGVSAILATAECPQIKALVTLASPDTTLHDPQLRQQLRALGRVPSPSSRTGEQLFIGRAIIDDIDAAGGRYDLHRRLHDFGGAYLAVHAKGDQTVGYASAERLAEAHDRGPTELWTPDDSTHTFDFRHGQDGSTEMLDAVILRVLAFLKSHLVYAD